MDSVRTPGGTQPSGVLSVMVLGGYGLIGSAVMRRLQAVGHRVVGVGRLQAAAAQTPFDEWRLFDIGMRSVADWRQNLQDIDVVVNASGALQDGARDDLVSVHETALRNLGEALAGTSKRIVQISAAGVSEDASTEFFRSKARGEAALRKSGASYVILRPTLVLAPTAYGGTALLRAGAALPLILPRVLPEAQIQCVHVDDLAPALWADPLGPMVKVLPSIILAVTTLAFLDNR